MADAELFQLRQEIKPNPWDVLAKNYADFVGETGDEVRQHTLDSYLLKLIGNIAGQAILDAGCAHGYWSRIFAGRAEIVHALDYSDELLAIARSGINPANLHFSKHDLTQELPFPANTFGLTFSSLTLDYFPSLNELAKEFARVTGKRVIVAVHHPDYLSSKYEIPSGITEGVNGASPAYTYSRRIFGEQEVTAFYRTVEENIEPFRSAGLRLTSMLETQYPKRFQARRGNYSGNRFLILEFMKPLDSFGDTGTNSRGIRRC